MSDAIQLLLTFYEKHVLPFWYSLRGLVSALVLNSLFFIFIITSQIELTSPLLGIIALVIYISIIFYWFYSRSLPQFDDDEVGIIFAIIGTTHEEEKTLNKIFHKLKGKIFQSVDTTNCRVQRLTPNNYPNNKKEAHILREKTNSRMLIWAETDSGPINKSETIEISPIHFTYASPELDRNLKQQYLALSRKVMLDKKWSMSMENMLIERKYIINNINEVVQYILGITYSIVRDVDTSDSFLVPLFNDLIATSSKTKQNLLPTTTSFLISNQLYRLQAFKLLLSDKNDSEKIQSIRNIINTIKKYDNSSIDANLYQAILYVMDDNTTAAIKLIDEVIEKTKHKDCTPYYSKAFIKFYEKDFDSGLNFLNKAINKNLTIGINPSVLINIILFYQDVLANAPSQWYLHLPLGLINIYILEDYNLAEKDLKTFIDSAEQSELQWAKNQKVEIAMVNIAKKELEKLKTS